MFDLFSRNLVYFCSFWNDVKLLNEDSMQHKSLSPAGWFSDGVTILSMFLFQFFFFFWYILYYILQMYKLDDQPL